jgi:glc operon protein GlcG
MYRIGKVSAKEALQLIQAVIAEAEKFGKHVAVAVCGPEGELVSFARMDEVNPTSGVIAQSKAYTAARDRQETRGMGEWMRKSQTPPAFWGDPNITGFGGGVPILADGRVVGAIGVSGLSEDEDAQLAKAAIAAVAIG